MNEERIARIVEAVVKKLESSPAPAVHRTAPTIGGRGVHPDVDTAAKAARKAFLQLSEISLADRKRYIQALRDVTYRELNTMSRMAVDETGLGRYEDKIEKIDS